MEDGADQPMSFAFPKGFMQEKITLLIALCSVCILGHTTMLKLMISHCVMYAWKDVSGKYSDRVLLLYWMLLWLSALEH